MLYRRVRVLDQSLVLTTEQALSFARLALDGIQREYPHVGIYVINGPNDLPLGSPRALHPAFYGCYDWHSAVHSHWMLVRLLRVMPALPLAPEIRAALAENLSAENLSGELSYLQHPGRRTFERTYGWAWLLKLAEELHSWNDPHGKEWAGNLQPLAELFVARYLEFLPRQRYPIRVGTHANTAFGFALAWDYAHTVGHAELEGLIQERSQTYFGADQACPAAWEPGGNDFLSPCLIEADLMRRILPPDSFRDWLAGFLPGLSDSEPVSLFAPINLTDHTDPQIVHLDGLNLSRAWCMLHIASSLQADERAHTVLLEAARRHVEAALPHISSGDYMGEHWLASFAVYLLSDADGRQ